MTHKEAIEKDGYIVVSPISGSMRPLIRENVDFGRFVSVKDRRPRVGDVVLYPGCGHNEGKTVMHRIIGTSGDNFIIQGDNARMREIVPKSEIFGVMTGYFRGEKFRSCRNPVFLLYSFRMISARRIVYTYRTSKLPFFKGARFLWRKVLHDA